MGKRSTRKPNNSATRIQDRWDCLRFRGDRVIHAEMNQYIQKTTQARPTIRRKISTLYLLIRYTGLSRRILSFWNARCCWVNWTQPNDVFRIYLHSRRCHRTQGFSQLSLERDAWCQPGCERNFCRDVRHQFGYDSCEIRKRCGECSFEGVL